MKRLSLLLMCVCLPLNLWADWYNTPQEIKRSDSGTLWFNTGFDNNCASYPSGQASTNIITIDGTSVSATTIFGADFDVAQNADCHTNTTITSPNVGWSSSGATSVNPGGFDVRTQAVKLSLDTGQSYPNSLIVRTGQIAPGQVIYNTWKIQPEPSFAGSSLGLTTSYTTAVLADQVIGKFVLSDTSDDGIEVKEVQVSLTEVDTGAVSLIDDLEIYYDVNGNGAYDGGTDRLVSTTVASPGQGNNTVTVNPGTASDNDISKSGSKQYLIVCDIDSTGTAAAKQLRVSLSTASLSMASKVHWGTTMNWQSTTNLSFTFSMVDGSAGVHYVNAVAAYVAPQTLTVPDVDNHVLGAFSVTTDNVSTTSTVSFTGLSVEFTGVISADSVTDDMSEDIAVYTLYQDGDGDQSVDSSDTVLSQIIGPISSASQTFTFDSVQISGVRKFFYITITLSPSITTFDSANTISYRFNPSSDMALSATGGVAVISHNNVEDIAGSSIAIRQGLAVAEDDDGTGTNINSNSSTTLTDNTGQRKSDGGSNAATALGAALSMALNMVKDAERPGVYDKEKLEGKNPTDPPPASPSERKEDEGDKDD